MTILRRISCVVAVSLLSFACAIEAHADTFGTYGDVQVVTGPNGQPAFKLTSDTSGVGYAGLEIKFNNDLTPATLTQLSADFAFLSGTIGGGAPRFTIFDDNLNSAYVYFGTPQGGGTFTDPNPGASESTGNFANPFSTDVRVASNGFNGIGDGNTYETFAQFVASSPTTNISYITLDLDGGFTGTQIAEFQNFNVNGTLYNPEVVSPTPEPSSLLLLGTGMLGIGARIRYRRRAV